MKKSKTSTDDRKLVDRLIPDSSFGRLLGVLATTYEMQPEFFETDFLPTSLGLGAWDDRAWSSRIALEKHLAELESATMFLDARPYRGRPRSLRIEVQPVPLGAGRSLHAKVLICVFDEAIRLIVGSANLTEPGYRRNREVAAVLTASRQRPGECGLIREALLGLDSILGTRMTESASNLCAIAQERLGEWSLPAQPAEEWFAWSGDDQPLWELFLDRWPAGELIQRITIVSPFWSEEHQSGPPVGTFVSACRERAGFTTDAQLLLLTEASPDTQTTWRPRLPESFATFDGRTIGIEAVAWPVDPRVPTEEVGLSDEFVGTRNLHAKVVLVEGTESSLAYVGSANFTRHGWGFLTDPHAANIEAGLIVRRGGLLRHTLRSLIPATTGSGVSLAGTAASRLALPDPSPAELPWPNFLHEISLTQSKTIPDQLDLTIRVEGHVAGSWSVAHLPIVDAPQEPLCAFESIAPVPEETRIPVTQETLNRLLREQEVHVAWWECAEGRAFPINVAAPARTALPISPGSGRPEEQHLIAYYQGRLTWEELFPDPDANPPTGSAGHDPDDRSRVDTSRIQSYVVREFVEALKGIRDDLKAASQSSAACMRLALLGSVSPVALAKRVVEAAERHERTPTASGFQLVEILACLDSAMSIEPLARFREVWLTLVDEAAAKVIAMLEKLQQEFPEHLSRDFRRFATTVRKHHRRQTVEPS